MSEFYGNDGFPVALNAESVSFPSQQMRSRGAMGSMTARALAFLDWPMDTFLLRQIGMALVAQFCPGGLRAEQPFLLLVIPSGGYMARFALSLFDWSMKRRADQLAGMAFTAFLTCHGIGCHHLGSCEMKQHQCGGQGAKEKRDCFHNKPL